MSQGKLQIGGQAVIEGAMMRHRSQIVIAVVLPDPFSERYRLFKMPILRGMSAFVEARS